jgi:hypothetical protein
VTDLVAELECVLAPEAVLRVQLNNILPILTPLVEYDRSLLGSTYTDEIVRRFTSKRKKDLSYTGKYGVNILGVSLPPVFRQDLNIRSFPLFLKFGCRNFCF